MLVAPSLCGGHKLAAALPGPSLRVAVRTLRFSRLRRKLIAIEDGEDIPSHCKASAKFIKDPGDKNIYLLENISTYVLYSL
jgi:hypothetical protein